MDFQNKMFTQQEVELYKDSLADSDLTGANLAGLNLTGAHLNGKAVREAGARSGRIVRSKLSRANFTGANLSEADLSRANLTEANLTGANLTGADIEQADFSQANLTGAIFTNASLREAVFTEADLSGGDLSGVNSNDVVFDNANLTRANFSGASLRMADLEGANLTEANLSGADLSGYTLKTRVVDANLRRANLIGANLTLTDFMGANLTDANLTGANLTGAIFTETNLSGANLTNANLSGTDFTGVDFTGVISSGITGIPWQLPEGWELIDGCLRIEVRNKVNLMRKLDKFNVNREPRSRLPRQLNIKDTVKRQSTCFDLILQEDYNINDFLLGRTQDDIDNPPDETYISRRLVFFVGQDRDNLQPYCYDLENLLADLNSSIYTTDCTTYPRRLYKPLFKLTFGYTVYVYLSDMIDVLTTTDKRVFIILPRIIDDEQEEIMKTGALHILGPNPDHVGADHCQVGTNKKVYNIFACEGQDGDPCYPIEQA